MTPTRRAFLQQLGFATAGTALISFAPGCSTFPRYAGSRSLPRSTPEAEGISSAAIGAFLDGMAQARHELHSVMIVRRGRVIAEGWWAPYAPTLNHTMYSMSKSFTSTAVGLAVAEGRLSVDDKVVRFFPKELPEKISENLAALRVRDLLTMSVGHAKDPTFEVVKSADWVRTFLAEPIANAPGTQFIYNSVATYMCSVIVQTLTGQRIVDYLRPRLFAPLGIEGATWEVCPRGFNTGGWGLNIRSEGLAKFGELYRQHGTWQGRQILPVKWIEEATSFHIQQPVAAKPARPKEQDDWKQGYGYQFWRCTHNAFRGDGAFGQFTIVLPEQEAVIVMTGENSNMQGELDLVWQHLLPAFGKAPLAPDAKASGDLRARLDSLTLAPLKGTPTSPVSATVSGKEFQLAENSLKLTRASFAFANDTVAATFRDAQGAHVITAGLEQWRHGTTALPGTPPRLITGRLPGGPRPLPIAASATWRDTNTLECLLRFIETPHHDTITCKFAGDRVQVSFLSSIMKLRGQTKDTRPVLEGKMSGTA